MVIAVSSTGKRKPSSERFEGMVAQNQTRTRSWDEIVNDPNLTPDQRGRELHQFDAMMRGKNPPGANTYGYPEGGLPSGSPRPVPPPVSPDAAGRAKNALNKMNIDPALREQLQKHLPR